MEITISLNEKEIIEVLRQHFVQKGFDVTDWQVYAANERLIYADLRMNADNIVAKKSDVEQFGF
ncbi:hypothetical protein [Heyndrickxia oleronia]|uniref:Uncharacterized protein n=1 Tax=Heyndrickxia oleronia TaxID=38875 RepID=A0AAW6SM92_9BACI|nr:hypothetical protein [Heyndrickxia oleronia]MDH5159881.1 hypothetical protein [Heyndrickxia oleronia]